MRLQRRSDQERVVRWLKRTRLHPRATQFDYLHLWYLREGLSTALREVNGPVQDVLDLYCGARPYDDLLPAGSRSVGLDIRDDYGVADVVTDEFLPFPDHSFDLVLCTEAFYFVPDPSEGAAEIRRVLRPGGSVILTVPLVWDYDPTTLEHRYTASSLARMFAEWDDVSVSENGGRAVAWAFVTGRVLDIAERKLRNRTRFALVFHPLFVACYLAINAVGALADRLDRRRSPEEPTLPMNLLLRARRPAA